MTVTNVEVDQREIAIEPYLSKRNARLNLSKTSATQREQLNSDSRDDIAAKHWIWFSQLRALYVCKFICSLEMYGTFFLIPFSRYSDQSGNKSSNNVERVIHTQNVATSRKRKDGYKASLSVGKRALCLYEYILSPTDRVTLPSLLEHFWTDFQTASLQLYGTTIEAI